MIAAGKQVFLRTVVPDDLTTLLAWENDPEIWSYGDNKQAYSMEEMEAFVNSDHDLIRHRQIRYMICLLRSKRAVGCIDLFNFDKNRRQAGVGILIYNYRDREKGYAMESLSLLKEFCRKTHYMQRLFCIINQNNPASLALFGKAGFRALKGMQPDLPWEPNHVTMVNNNL